MKEADYLEQQLNLFMNYENGQVRQDTLFGRTFQEPLVRITELILEPCLKKSQRPKFQCLSITNGQSQVMWNGGGASSIAWRTLDAQYWGVPQRRRRIFLVADFGGFTAGEILFIEQGLCRDIEKSQGEGQEAANDVGASIDSASGFKYLQIVIDQQGGKGQANYAIEKSPTLATESHGTPHTVCYSMGHDERSAQFTPNKTDPLTASDYKQPTIVGGPKIAGTLSATFYKGAGNNSVDACLWPDLKANTVRRLTPLECERLQGLPDQWTNIDFNGKPAPDSKRYKAIGNGMAVPCSDFIMKRIAEVMNDENV